MGEHLVQFYDDETFLVDEIWNFIGPCLRMGDAAVVIATPARLENLERKYAPARRAGVAAGSAARRCIMLDANAILSDIMIDDWPDQVRFQNAIGAVLRQATDNGRHQVRAYGEMVALLCAQGKQEAALRLEQFWNDLAKEYPFSLMCGYPMNVFASEEHSAAFAAVCSAHTHVHPAESYRAPGNENELRRMIAQLQQKSAALESEIVRRKAVECALSQREADLSDFLENAVEAMHRVGPDGRILWANKAELALLGYPSEQYIGRHIADFHVDRDAIGGTLNRLLRGETLYDCPAAIRCMDGSVKHVLVHSNALFEDGKLVYTRCLMRDVTDRLRLEEELNAKLLELADIDRRKDEFLAMLGHELRNPLAPIMNSLELMRICTDDAMQMTRARETIARQTALMTRLVDDLLDVSRITRGKIELKMKRTSLDQIIERAIETSRPLIEERQHQLLLSLPANQVHLYGDPERLAQAIANLLHNAAKYTDIGGRISLHAYQDNKHLALEVADNGIGIDSAMREKVFDLFVQDASSLTKARGGLGLGLTLVRNLVRLHGGSVEAHSEGIGRGSQFVVTLPLDMSPTTIASEPEPATSSTAPHAHPRRILIVDDNIDAAESLGEFLKASGHRIHVVHDGVSAIHEALRLRPEVVILDIGMPSMNGYQVAQRLRREVGLTSSLLIAVTGYAQERDRSAARSAGFDHHFSKPLDIGRLTAILRGQD